MKRFLVVLALLFSFVCPTLGQQSGSLTAADQTVVASVVGAAVASFTVSGTFSGTVNFEVSPDGISYTALSVSPVGAGATGTSATAPGVWLATIPALNSVRVKAGVWVSGTAVVDIRVSSIGGVVGNTAEFSGNLTIDDVVIASSALPTGASTAAHQVTAQTSLTSLLANTAPTLSASTLLAPGSEGTTAAIAGGIYNSTPPTFTNGQKGAVQLNAAGALKVDLVGDAAAAFVNTGTFTGTGSSTVTDVSTVGKTKFSMQVKGTGAAATLWVVELMTSNDGVNYASIVRHSSAGGDTDGGIVGPALPSPRRYFKSTVTSLTLGSATNIVVTIVGMP